MKVLAISDLHGELGRLDQLEPVLRRVNPDLVVFAGDVVKGKKRGDEWLAAQKEGRAPNRDLAGLREEIEQDVKTLEAFLDRFARWGVPLAYVPGNMDSPKEHFLFEAVSAETAHPNVRCVHGGGWVFKNKYAVFGFGGDISKDTYEDVFQFVSPRWEVEYQLKFVDDYDQPLVLVFHIPPTQIAKTDPEVDVGPQVVHEMIKTHRPALAVVGHIHDEQVRTQIGSSLVVCPGALKKGKYAVITLPKGDVEFGSL